MDDVCILSERVYYIDELNLKNFEFRIANIKVVQPQFFDVIGAVTFKQFNVMVDGLEFFLLRRQFRVFCVKTPYVRHESTNIDFAEKDSDERKQCERRKEYAEFATDTTTPRATDKAK